LANSFTIPFQENQNMTRFTVFASTLVLLVGIGNLSAQNAPKINAREFYERHAYELAQPFETGNSGPKVVMAHAVSAKDAAPPSASVPSAPGDNASFVTLHLNAEFYNFGDRLVATLVGFQQVGAFTIYGRRTVYNEETQQSQSEFFQPSVCGYPGFCGGGILTGQNLQVYSAEISENEIQGDYALDFSISDMQGQLVQQVFAYYYVGHPSRFGRYYFRVDRAEIVQTNSGGPTVALFGQFPQNEAVMVWAGNLTEGTAAWAPARSPDGRTILFPLWFPNGHEGWADFTVLFPQLRVSWTLPKGVFLPAGASNAGVPITVPAQ
jgi:hypothetical protein